MDYDEDGVLAPLAGGYASDGVILTSQPGLDPDGPEITSPVPGVVLTIDGDGECVITWDAVPSATNYRVSIGSTSGGDEHGQTTTTGTELDIASYLPGDGSIVYVRVESYIASTWTPNDFLYYDHATTRHLFRHPRGLGACTQDANEHPNVQCDDQRKRALGGALLMPLGGAPQIEPVPSWADAELWSYARNPPIVHFQMVTRGGIQVGEIIDAPPVHDIVCGTQLLPEPEDPALATLVSPAADATLGGTTATVTIAGVTGALEYGLTIGNFSDGFGDGAYYNASLGTDVSVEVTGLPDDGRKLVIRVWVKLSGRPYWRHNDYVWTAYTA